MADNCNDPKSQKVSTAFPNTQTVNAGALQVNLDANADSIFNPNNLLSAVNTYLSINNVVNKMFGIEARWFRAVPQERSKEVVLKEWTLYCVEDAPLCLKVLLPDGNFPDSKYQYDLMGLEYEIPLTIHIDKKYWEEIAGFGTAPQKKDIVYLPMPNKIYQVESAFLDRGFMEQETHWVLNLRKYMPEASRRESLALQETVDKYTVSQEELLGEDLRNEYSKITDDKQFSQFNSTSRDKYKMLDASLRIIPYDLEIHGIKVAESYYDLNTSGVYNAIIYNKGDEISERDDRSVTSWIYPRTVDKNEYRVKWILKDTTITPPANYKIKIESRKGFSIGDTFVISRPGALNFYATVVDDSNQNDGIYFCQIDDDVVNYLNSISSSWTTARNYMMRVQKPITILDGINDTETGFRVLLYANQYVKIRYGTQTHVAYMDKKIEDEAWYGIVVNIGNSWAQYNFYIWSINLSDPTEKLSIKYYQTLTLEPEMTKIDQYTIDKSDAFMTNIRLFKTTIEEEKQSKELLSYFSKDGDQALILDNADPRFKAPYISKQR